MNQITITLPMPHKHLSPNSRCHWAQKSQQKRNQRHQSQALIREALNDKCSPHWTAANVQITVTPPDARRRDKDNLLASLKAAFDGAQDAGLITDDSGLTYLPITIQTPDKHNAGVRLTFTKTK